MRGGDSTGTKPIPLGGEAQAGSLGKAQGSKRCCGAGGDRCTANILLELNGWLHAFFDGVPLPRDAQVGASCVADGAASCIHASKAWAWL